MNRLETFGLIAAQAERGEIIFPTSVNAALRLQLALDDPDCHIEDAIKLVLGEPQLAARTVALANSAAFNRNGEATVTNVRAAVMRIGYRSLQTLVASLVVRQFGARIVDPELRAKAEQLWEHTAHVAALSQVLARRVTFINPDTALFAAIVHEVGGFYLLSRADEFPGLLDADPENWIELCEEVVSREVMRKLAIPEPVMDAIKGLRTGLLNMPPSTLLDTLLLANQLAPVASPLALRAPATATPHEESALDFVMDQGTLDSILKESADEVQSMSAALLV
ncbi:HDOD domain-containing protein [Massilia sp. R2A-15]|uniref:HDOD domain-containing protein n=1 Tax=Massilia sp. R2A-15 TaxID=3064278 RepID=UPI0027334DDC|nr:HDOD domain-containing protein [Massilia sp. R2A-15]WLI88132.1 HDOD domain-containing protein [Massilia sp. R2A-15]